MMDRFATTIILLAVLSVTGSLALASDPEPRLHVSLRTDEATYDLASEVKLEVLVTNYGSAPITLFGRLLWGRMGGLILHICDEDGSPVHSRFLDHDMIVPEWLTEPVNYVRLYPRHSLGISRRDRISDLVPKPGQYEIYVEYLSPVAEKLSPSPDFWSRERGAVKSASTTIEVVGVQ